MLAIHERGRYHHAMNRAPAGDNAELIELGDVTASELHAAAAEMRAQPGVAAVIPGHSSLYVIRGQAGIAHAMNLREPREHRLRVAFDGADLPELLARVDREEFFARLPELRLIARYLGFRGGFAYLDGWPVEWAMPRRPTSRPVARGTFAVAGNVAGFYPIDSPGGWNLLGTTDADLENALVPGDVIGIVPVERAALAARPPSDASFGGLKPAAPQVRSATLIASPLVTLVSQRAAFDDLAAAIATRAVAGDVELLECAMSGPRLRFTRDAVIAWCTPSLEVRVEHVRAGDERAFGRIEGGLRAYLAIGQREGIVAKVDRSVAKVNRGDRHVIRALRGPHDVDLGAIECEVTPQLNRVGIRLRPLRDLGIAAPADLRSCGMQCGTVQLHPDGTLVVMGPDHPVTGGYLQPMTVITSERWKLAQLMPGERVTLLAQPPN
jgi:allophanate hydrolase subunit 1